MRVNLILWMHRGGQIAGCELLRQVLEEQGCSVRLCISGREVPCEEHRADCNVFSSEIAPQWMPLAPRNVLLANQEQDLRQALKVVPWGPLGNREGQARALQCLDKVLAKTRHAEQVYRSLGVDAVHVGFASRDRSLAGIDKDYGQWLCVIGDNFINKDAHTVVQVWQRNPDFPKLLLCLHGLLPGLPQQPPPNLSYRLGILGEEELRQLHNRCGVHVCPSRMEGWGHCIVESMSTGALVLTTNAPPMNEHVDETRGVCFGFRSSAPHGLGIRHEIDAAALKQAVRRAVALCPQEREARCLRAREYFQRTRRQFPTRFGEVWRDLQREWPTTSIKAIPADLAAMPVISCAEQELLKQGREHLAKGWASEAETIARKLLDGGWEAGLPLLILALQRQSRGREAADCLRQQLAVRPTDARLHNNLGAILADAGELDAAIGHLEQACQLRPGYGEAWANLAAALGQLGRLKKATAACRRAIEAAPHSPAIQRRCQHLLAEWSKARPQA